MERFQALMLVGAGWVVVGGDTLAGARKAARGVSGELFWITDLRSGVKYGWRGVRRG